MNTVIVTGSDGQLGRELQLSEHDREIQFYFFNKKELDILSFSSIDEVFENYSPTHVINLAAYTNVENAETDHDAAYEINVTGAKNLAYLCKKYAALLVHISTDYVFGDNEKEFLTETDETRPLNFYGKTKLESEEEIVKSGCDHVIIRTSWMYSNFGENFYTKMLQLSQKTSEISVVEDQYGSPTSTKEICKAIDTILHIPVEKIENGIYHFSGKGKTNWSEFASEIFKQSKIPVIVKGVTSKCYPLSARRPNNSYLSSEKFEKVFGVCPLNWKLALEINVLEKKISPIKVGYIVPILHDQFVIASVDWSKKECVLAQINNMKNITFLKFENLQK